MYLTFQLLFKILAIITFYKLFVYLNLTNYVKTQLFKMESFGDTIRKLREDKELPLRTVAAFLNIDLAILSKIERGHRKPARELVVKFAEYFSVKENDLLVAWLSDKVVYELEDEEVALQALQMAEAKVAYTAFKKVDRKEIVSRIKSGIKKFPLIEKAWIYGSFARQDDGPKSDVDIALQTNGKFTYFDLAEVQYQLENSINRKVDVGFIDSFKPYIWEHVKPELKLIYEKSGDQVVKTVVENSEARPAGKNKPKVR